MGVLKKAIKPQFLRGKWKILRGDTVHITVGKDKGQLGTVSKVIRDDRMPRVIVEGRNLVSACFELRRIMFTSSADSATMQLHIRVLNAAANVAVCVCCRSPSGTSSAQRATRAASSPPSRRCTTPTCGWWTRSRMRPCA